MPSSMPSSEEHARRPHTATSDAARVDRAQDDDRNPVAIAIKP
jgi:hypothetical protein